MFDLSIEETESGILVLRVDGRLDADSNEYFFECVHSQIEDGNQRIVINCEGLGYISSIGVGTLVRIRSRLVKLGGQICLSNVQSMVLDMFRLISMDRLLGIYPTEQEAIQAIESADNPAS